MQDILHQVRAMKRGERLARICLHSLAVVVQQVPDLESAEIRVPPLAFLQTSLDTKGSTS
jgi:hypothetical protein